MCFPWETCGFEILGVKTRAIPSADNDTSGPEMGPCRLTSIDEADENSGAIAVWGCSRWSRCFAPCPSLNSLAGLLSMIDTSGRIMQFKRMHEGVTSGTKGAEYVASFRYIVFGQVGKQAHGLADRLIDK